MLACKPTASTDASAQTCMGLTACVGAELARKFYDMRRTFNHAGLTIRSQVPPPARVLRCQRWRVSADAKVFVGFAA